MQLKDAGVEYLAFLGATGASSSAIKNVTFTLNQLLDTTGDVTSGAITHVHIQRLIADHNWAPTTYNLKISHVRQFIEWLKRRRYMPSTHDPMYGFSCMKVPQKVRLRVPQSEWARVLDCAHHPADRMLVACGLYLMARPSEIASVRMHDVDIDKMTVQLIRHKTRRVDLMPICTELLEEIQRWLAWYESHAKVGPDSYFIPRKRPGGFCEDESTRDVEPGCRLSEPHKKVQAALLRAGYRTKQEGGHTLRRSGARAYYEELVSTGHDGALRQVQTMLDHRDSAVTEIYLGTSRDKAERERNLKGKPMFRRTDGRGDHAHV